MKIYVDMLFAINFSMDFLVLIFTARLMRRRVHKKRILISACIGGLYGVFDVILYFAPIISFAISILTSFLMCYISFYEKNVKKFAVVYLSYWGINACLGGFMSIFYSFLNKILSNYIASHSQSTAYSNARFLVILLLTVLVSTLFGRSFVKESKIKSVQIIAHLNNKIFDFYGLVDSGNLLTDPISGKKVILVSEGSKVGKEISKISDIKKRFIPYTALGNDGVLKGIIPKAIEIDGVETVAIIAPVSKNDFGGYEACVPYALL